MEGRLLSGFESQSQDLGLRQRCDNALKLKQILIENSSGVKSNYFLKRNNQYQIVMIASNISIVERIFFVLSISTITYFIKIIQNQYISNENILL